MSYPGHSLVGGGGVSYPTAEKQTINFTALAVNKLAKIESYEHTYTK